MLIKTEACYQILNNNMVTCLKESDDNRMIGKSSAIIKKIIEDFLSDKLCIVIINSDSKIQKTYYKYLGSNMGYNEEDINKVLKATVFCTVNELEKHLTYNKGKYSYNIYIDDISEENYKKLRNILPLEKLSGWYH